MFNFNQLLYDNQGTENTGWLNDDVIKSAAASIPGPRREPIPERPRLRRPSRTPSPRSTRRPTRRRVSGTPTIYVVHKGGKPQLVTLSASGDPSALETAINTRRSG